MLDFIIVELKAFKLTDITIQSEDDEDADEEIMFFLDDVFTALAKINKSRVIFFYIIYKFINFLKNILIF